MKRRSSSPTRPPRADATRRRLIQCAYRLFITRGFHGTSMRAIASTSGLALGGIYNHFANKEQIFSAVLEAYHPYNVMLPALNAAEGHNAEEFVRDAAARLWRSSRGLESRVVPILMIEIVEFQGRHLRKLVEKILPLALQSARRMPKDSRLRKLEDRVILRTTLALVVGFLVSEMIVSRSSMFSDRDDWVSGITDIFLHGILEQ